MVRNKPLLTLVIIFIFINIVDIITAFKILPGESNPLYLITGSMISLIVLKICIMVYLFYLWHRNIFPNHFTYYMLVLILVMGSTALTFAVYSNVRGMLDQQLVEQAASLSDDVKMKAYVTFVSFVYVIPMAFSLLAFWVYDKSFKHTIFDKQYFKNRPWWKFL